MSKFHDKVEGRTKQFVGQIIGDDQLVREGKTQERKAEDDRSGRGDQSAPHQEMAHSDQGIVKDQKAGEQPKDKERAQLVHKTDANNSVSREATATHAPDDGSRKSKPRWRFDFGAKECKPIIVNEQCEVLSLMGHVAQGDDGKASLHLHAALDLAGDAVDPAGD